MLVGHGRGPVGQLLRGIRALQLSHDGRPLRSAVRTLLSISRRDAMELGWKRHLLDLDFNIVDLVQAESGEIWAALQRQRRGGNASAILRRRLEEWECV